MANSDDNKPATQADAAALQSKYGVDFDSLGDHTPAAGDDSVQPTASPIDLAAGAAASKLAPAAEAGLKALAADETGVVNLGKMVRSGENGFAPIEGEGLAAQIPQGMTPEQTQSYLNGLWQAVQEGKLTADKYQGISNMLSRPKNYADGGAVSPGVDFDSLQADAPPAQSPTTAAPGGSGHAGVDFDSLTDDSEKYGTLGQTVLAGVEGGFKGALGPVATGAEALLTKAGVPGLKPEDQAGREEASPYVHGFTEAAGFVAPALASLGAAGAARLGLEGASAIGEAANAAHKFSQVGVLDSIGQGAISALGLAAPEGAIAKIGSAAVKGAIETAAFSGGDSVSKLINGDPNLSVESAIADAGLAAAIGGTLGGAIGSVSPLWHATVGPKANAYLSKLSDAMGGIEGGKVPGMSDAVADALESTGLGDKFAPEVRTALSDDPFLRNASSTLGQRDTGWRGPQHQAAMASARQETAAYQAEVLGTKLDDIPSKGDIDRYTTGKTAGDTLAKEYAAKIEPSAKAIGEYAERSKNEIIAPSIEDRAEASAAASDKAFGELQKANKDLQKSIKANYPAPAIEAEAAVREAQAGVQAADRAANAPGVLDDIQQRLAALSEKEGWNLSPSSDIAKEFARVQKELPNIKTLGDLTNYIKQIGQNTASDHPFGLTTPVSRAGGLMKSVLRDAESEVVASHLGPEELAKYRAAQAEFAKVAQIKDAVDSRLNAKGSATNYAKSVRAMAAEDGEKVLRKLSGTGDADWLATMQEHFPETAKVIRQHHIDQLIASSRDANGISTKKLMGNLEKMSPQVRDFTLSPAQQAKLETSSTIIEALNDRTHNWSNTARTADKLGLGGSGSALAAAAMLTGHGGVAATAASLVPSLFKIGGDEARHTLLKFLGSTSKVDGGAFKAAASFIANITKGEALITKATKNVFKEGADVLPASKVPSEEALDRLDKRLAALQKDPTPLVDSGGNVGHYMPEHAGALGETNARVVNYVNSKRPMEARLGPLDAPTPPSENDVQDFRKVLEIAQQPLTVVERIKDGSLAPEDVMHLQAMYPKIYDNLVNKLTAAMGDHVTAGEEVPYHTRMALSLFMGQPLDATMTPEAIIAAQPKPTEQPGQQPGPKHSTAKLGKLPNSYMTADQAAEAKNQPKK